MARGADDLVYTSTPTEVWGRIASFLSLHQCCKLASTCRALWTMDLPYVFVPGIKVLQEPERSGKVTALLLG